MNARMRVLDPTVAERCAQASPVALLDNLRDKVLGLRIDRAWQSYSRFAEHVTALARQHLGVRDVYVFDAGIRIGTTEEERRKVEGFVRAVDAAIVGLGT